MRKRRRRVPWILVAPVLALALAAPAAPTDDEAELKRVRCATRLSISLTGLSPSADLLAAADPQTMVGALLDTPEFHERFARFVNRSFNEEPGDLPVEDASYWLARKVVSEGLPWRELFTGAFRVVAATTADGKPTAQVNDDDNGLGYFRSPAWMRRYAGNEEAGYRLVSAYRIMQNLVGLELQAIDSVPDQDLSAAGRMAAECRGCHYDSPFALDKVAKILSRRQGEGADMTFVAPDEGPQTLLDGQSIADDRQLVEALADSTNFRFRACRLAFQYLYGRAENKCDGPLFDRCVDAFEATGLIQSALATIAEDPGFCE
jgi:hypothetical protein